MIQWAPYFFVRLTVYLIAGILLAIYFPAGEIRPLVYGLGVLTLAYLGLLVLLTTAGKGLRLQTLSGLLAAALTIGFGYTLTHVRTASRQADHIRHQPEFTWYAGTLSSEPQAKTKGFQAECTIREIRVNGQWRKASGTVLLYIRKNGGALHYGDQLLIRGMPQPVAAPANPNEFDYQRYLQFKNIYHRHFLNERQFVKTGESSPNPVLALALHIRRYADAQLKRLIQSPDEYGIASALILGIKDGLDNHVRQAYSSAGAMHILAVSGMHVGLFYAFLTFLLAPLKRLKYGQWTFYGAILLILWLYAFVTGLSPSVLRAVLMFTLLTVTRLLKRPTSIYNSIALSAWLLLCVNPFLVTDVGFQLSYAAVIGIIFLDPRMKNWLEFNYRIPAKLWEITCTSFAAQLATFPISMHYFHQFPTYFLLANLVVIILAQAILPVGLFLLAIAWVPYLSEWLGLALRWMIWLLNQTVFLTESIPGALISGISFSVPQVILLYGAIIFTVLFLYFRRLALWACTLGCVCVMVGLHFSKRLEQQSQRQLAIYSVNKHATLNVFEGNQHWFIADSTLLNDPAAMNFQLANHWLDKGESETRFLAFPEVTAADLPVHHFPEYTLLQWHGKRFVLLHRPLPRNYQFPAQLRADYLVVQHNALPYSRAADVASHFKTVILDSSNSPSRAAKLAGHIRRSGISCHSVAEAGAFVLND